MHNNSCKSESYYHEDGLIKDGSRTRNQNRLCCLHTRGETGFLTYLYRLLEDRCESC